MKKILIVHGWDYRNYSSSGCRDTWSNRSHFVEALSERFEVTRFNFPGFCGEKELENPWTIEDFVRYLDQVIKRGKPDIALGYSFGGAVLLRWKAVSGDKKIKTFLVSPAILRRYQRRSVSLGWLKSFFPAKLVFLARDFYLTRIVKNPYYAEASPVMRETYRNIVGLDLKQDLLDVSDTLVLVYGEKDSATPLEPVRDFLASRGERHELRIIKGGGHDIANTHTDKLISIISSLT